ncbi:MAG: hypothetical protein U0Y68_25460 [Blastocatellia bacterium]
MKEIYDETDPLICKISLALLANHRRKHLPDAFTPNRWRIP